MTNHKTGCSGCGSKQDCHGCGSKKCRKCGDNGNSAKKAVASRSSSSSSSNSNKGCPTCNTCGCDGGGDGECPDLAKLCPEDGIFFERVNIFGTSIFTGSPHNIFVDCEGCLTTAQRSALTAEFGFESVFIVGTEPIDGAWNLESFGPGGTPQGTSGTGALGAAKVIRELFLCGEADSVLVRFINAGEDFLREVTFNEAGDPSFRSGPAEFGVIASDSDVDAFLTCLGLSNADLIPGLPVQLSLNGYPTVAVPINNLAAIQGLNALATVPCIDALLAAMGLEPCTAVELFTTETLSPDADIHARVFGGTCFSEDPISAGPNVALGSYLTEYDVLGSPPLSIVIEQGSEFGRAGLVTVDTVEEAEGIFASVGGPIFFAAEAKANYTCDSEVPQARTAATRTARSANPAGAHVGRTQRRRAGR